MKRVLALWLAVCMICSLSCVSLAKTPGSSGRDSGESTSGGGFELQYYELAGLTSLRNYTARSATGNYFGDKLNDNAKIIYDVLLDYFQEIDSTGSGESLVYFDSGWGAGTGTGDDCLAAVYALLKDHSNLTYWVNISDGKDNTFRYGTVGSGGGSAAFCIFPVIPAYRDGEPMSYGGLDFYNIDASRDDESLTKKAALDKAAEIVRKAEALSSDYEKIRYFNETICDLTDYDNEAADPNAPYDDAYQMLNVFWGEPVVCEGYAKAFKYLCDEAGIGCFLVEGLYKDNNHMWNYVELDGKWYIVDVTNNDVSSDIESLLATGSDNSKYKGKYDSTQSYNVVGQLTPTLMNPDVTPEKGNYKPTETPVEPEKLTLRVYPAHSNRLQMALFDETGASYTGKYTIAKGDLTVTEITTTGANGKTYQPSAVTSNGNDYYIFDFDPALPAGTYHISVQEKAGYEVAIDSNTFTIKPRLPDPQISFGKPDQKGNVTVTIAVPGIASQNISVQYWVNDRWASGASPVSFSISATDPDPYPTKIVKAFAWHDDYESGDEVTASYTFAPAADAFQVIVTPVEGLHGFITTKTLMATLSVEHAKGKVTYELDPDKNHYGFQIEGNQVYSEPDYQLDPMDYPVYVIATDHLNSGEPITAYGNAVIHISEKEQGGNDDNDGSDDSDGGSSSGGGGGGSSSSASSGTGSAGNAAASAPLSAEQATSTAQAAISAAASTGASNASVRFSNVSTVSPEAFQSIADAAAKANVTANAVFDTVKANAVEARLVLDPAKAAAIAGGVNVSAVVNDPVVAGHFKKFFSNELAVATFGQKGPFGQSVSAALRLDLSKLDTRQLQFYEYNAATNTYKRVNIPWSIDANGYLWVTVTSGNSLIVTDKPLTLK